MAFPPVIPILRSFDEGKAREFYIQWLGFQVDFEHRFHDDAPLFMGISRDDLVIFLSERRTELEVLIMLPFG